MTVAKDRIALLDILRKAGAEGSEAALAAVIQEAYVHGVSTHKVDKLVRAMGLAGIDKSALSRIYARLDEEVQRFRERQLTEPVLYM